PRTYWCAPAHLLSRLTRSVSEEGPRSRFGFVAQSAATHRYFRSMSAGPLPTCTVTPDAAGSAYLAGNGNQAPGGGGGGPAGTRESPPPPLARADGVGSGDDTPTLAGPTGTRSSR